MKSVLEELKEKEIDEKTIVTLSNGIKVHFRKLKTFIQDSRTIFINFLRNKNRNEIFPKFFGTISIHGDIYLIFEKMDGNLEKILQSGLLNLTSNQVEELLMSEINRLEHVVGSNDSRFHESNIYFTLVPHFRLLFSMFSSHKQDIITLKMKIHHLFERARVLENTQSQMLQHKHLMSLLHKKNNKKTEVIKK